MIRLIREDIAQILSTTIFKIASTYSKSEYIDAIYMDAYLAPSNNRHALNRQSYVEITLVYNSIEYKKIYTN